MSIGKTDEEETAPRNGSGVPVVGIGASAGGIGALETMLPLLALLSVGIHANWKRGRLKDSQRTLLLSFVAAAVLGCGFVFGLY